MARNGEAELARRVIGTLEPTDSPLTIFDVRANLGDWTALVLNAIDTRSDAYYYYTYYHRLEYGAAIDGVEGAGPRGPRVPVGVGRSGGPVGPGGRGAPDGPGGAGVAGPGGGLGPRDRVLVPAAPPRGGLLRRINPFARDDDGPRGVRGGRIGRVRPDADRREDRDLGRGMLGDGARGGRGPVPGFETPDDLPPLEDPDGPY